MRFNFILLNVLSLGFLNACGFLKDNEKLSRILTPNAVSNTGETVSCAFPKTIENENHLDTTFACASEKFDKVSSQLKLTQPDKLFASEVVYILNTEVLKDFKIEVQEVKAVLKILTLFTDNKNPDYVVISDVKNVLHRNRSRAVKFYKSLMGAFSFEQKSNDIFVKGLSLLSEVASPVEIFQEDFESIVTLTKKVLTVATKKPSDFIVKNLNSKSAKIAYNAVSMVLGYSQNSKTRGISIDVVRLAAEKSLELDVFTFEERLSNELEKVCSAYAGSECPNAVRSKFRYVEYKKFFETLLAEVLQITGYANRGGFTKSDFTQLLKDIQLAGFVNKSGAKLDIQINAEALSERLFRFKSKLFGGNEEVFAAKSLESMARFLAELVLGTHLDGILIDVKDLAKPEEPSALKELNLDPNFWNFFSKNARYFTLKEHWHNRAQGRVALSSAYTTFHILRATTAGVAAFDRDSNFYLRGSGRGVSNEIKEMIRVFSEIYNVAATLSAITETDDVSDEIKKAREAHKQFLNTFLAGDLVSGLVSFYADNFGPFSHSDGVINGAEMLEIIELAQDLKESNSYLTHQSIFDSCRDPETEFWRSEALLFEGMSEVEAREFCARILLARKAIGYTIPDPTFQSMILHEHLALAARNIDFSKIKEEKFLEIQKRYRTDFQKVWTLFKDKDVSAYLAAELDESLKDESQKSSGEMLSQVWFKQLLDVHSFKYPFHGNNPEEVRQAVDQIDEEWRDSESVNVTIKFGNVRYSDFRAYFDRRFRGVSFVWLDKKMQAILMLVPDQITADFVSRMSFHSDAVLAEFVRLKKENPVIQLEKMSQELLKFVKKLSLEEDRDVSMVDLYVKSESLGQLFKELGDMKKSTEK